MSPEHQSTDGQHIERVHCNSCGHATRHVVLVDRKQPGTEELEDGDSVDWQTTWTTLECLGCESVCLRRTFWFSEWDRDALKVEFFPPPISRRPPRWLEQLTEDERQLTLEVYAALHAGSRRLAMMGARALVDMVMQRHAGDAGTFGSQLTELEKRGLIGKRQRRVLEAALDAGSAAAHRGHIPNVKDAETVVDIVENLLHAELLDAAAKGLRERTPPRPSRVKGSQLNRRK